jgi:hypothetical protein
MKNIIYIFFFFVFTLLIPRRSDAQELDTLGTVRFDNIEYLSYSELQFDLKLCRLSERWEGFANGTFQFVFDEQDFTITPERVEIILIESELNTAPITGQLPITNYHIIPRIMYNKFTVTILGPREFPNTNFIPLNECINLGTFLIRTTDESRVPGGLNWVMPLDYYQSIAYKVKQDPPIPEDLIAGYKNDNIGMDRRFGNYTNFEGGKAPAPEFILKYFDVEYAGVKDVKISWETESEAFAEGFVVLRGLKPLGVTDPAEVTYSTVAAHFNEGPFADDSRAKGTNTSGAFYELEYDSVEFRGPDYCYSLYYMDEFGDIHFLAYDCTPIPKSVIAEAHPKTNPFSSSTVIEYEVSDDVMLTAKVYDVVGKEVDVLIRKQRIEKGQYEVTFRAPKLASQGLYDVVFIAYPIEDPSIEISTAVVKLQLIR